MFVDGDPKRGLAETAETGKITKHVADRAEEIQQTFKGALDAVAEKQIAPAREALATKPESYFPTPQEIELTADDDVELGKRIEQVNPSVP